MRDLQLVGISEDRSHLVLTDADTGAEFRVPVDDSLRAALRGDRSRPGHLESPMDSALRPRDIQARIRAGATPEEVAEVAHVPVERIMGYAVPVLAEREHIVERARTASVRRRHSEGPTRLLGETVVAQLRARGQDPQAATWDSWRRDDGRWVVTVAPDEGDEVAHYVYDAAGRYVLADDDVARVLIADEPPTEDPSTMDVAAAVQPTATEPVTEPVTVDPPDWSPLAEPPTPHAEASTPVGADAPGADREDARQPAQPIARLRRRRALHQVPDPLPLDEVGEETGEGPDTGPDEAAAAHDDEPTAPAETPEPEQPARPEPRRRRDRRRASVPSWDEIMFGGGKSD